jgi:biotin operon repressor
MDSRRHPRLSLDLLRGFEAAARHLSFTRAADELFVTQAAISHQIKALRQQLGQPLFSRVNRGLARVLGRRRCGREAWLNVTPRRGRGSGRRKA